MGRKAVRLDAAQRGKRDGVRQAAHQPVCRAWQPGGNLEPPHAHYSHQWLFGALAPPALDGAIQYAFLVSHMGPEFGEHRVGRGRTPRFLQIVQTDTDRDRHAFAADHAFAVAQRRDGFEKAPRAFRPGVRSEEPTYELK